MPGPSSSQEIDLEYVTWLAPDSPPIAIRRHAMEGIHQEVSEAFAAAPHRGPETGGILLGRRAPDGVVVEDFEPIPSEHRFGPSYRLSEADCGLLQETLEWFRGGAQPGLSVLGFYRSHALPDMELGREDEELLRAHFAPDEDLVLLVKPSLSGPSDQDFCIRRCGRPVPPPAPNPQLIEWPPPRPRLSQADTEPDIGRPRRRWPWVAGAILLGLLGGAAGYLWWHPNAGVERIVAATPAPPPATRPIVEATPAPLEPDTTGIHELLNRWAAALKRGDVDTATQCYAAVVNTYFTRHDVTREAVRQSIRQARARYGRLGAYRISAIGITPVSDSRAVATFRKYWQTSGRKRSAGEEEERMTLVRTGEVWQISSEQAETR